LDQNADKIKGANVGSAEPTFEKIASGEYPVSRSLYFYVKKANMAVTPGLLVDIWKKLALFHFQLINVLKFVLT